MTEPPLEIVPSGLPLEVDANRHAGTTWRFVSDRTDALWASWQTSTTSTYTWDAATVRNTIWMTWTSTTANVSVPGGNYRWDTHIHNVPDPTPVEEAEQREIERMLEESRIARQAERVAERAELRQAEATATLLLLSLLSPAQRDEWAQDEKFEVTGSDGGTYVIRKGVAGNVRRMEDGVAVESLCAHPPTTLYDEDGHRAGTLPTVDVVITQMLHLERDEADFRRRANITRHQYQAARYREPLEEIAV